MQSPNITSPRRDDRLLLINLPQNTLRTIASYLPAPSHAMFGLTCHEIRRIARSVIPAGQYINPVDLLSSDTPFSPMMYELLEGWMAKQNFIYCDAKNLFVLLSSCENGRCGCLRCDRAYDGFALAKHLVWTARRA